MQESSQAQLTSSGAATWLRNVRVFDGVSDQLSEPCHVLVRGNAIALVGDDGEQDGAAAPGERNVLEIDGAGNVLMPGLIDAHYHTAFASVSLQELMTGDLGYLGIRSAEAATETLLRGFTTVRDAGGPVFGVKRAIDEGRVVGPRIFPSGAMISQTSGHGDFRQPYEVPRGVCGHFAHIEIAGGSAIADGVSEVLRATREQLMHGASQIKVMAGGGVASSYDPLDVTEYTEVEMRAAVEAAENWGTYVTVHAYTDRAVQQAIRAGVRCIEHGQLVTEETVSIMAEHGTWWSLQAFGASEQQIAKFDPAQRARFRQVAEGTDRAYALAAKHGVKVAWGTDLLFDPAAAAGQGSMLVATRRWQTPFEVLRTATSGNAELLAMSGQRNPYPGALGVIRPGALADLLLVRGNPLTDLDLLASPDTSLSLIMRDGRIHKNTCPTTDDSGPQPGQH
ncbi:metal-dependent hydrolase family protein [Kutzneria sp. CA-103260]|uniref:metal-dependent hydrolase family protein n=1 Tax=Kutzneria sp. CA-103260 TaxID=2802641 RepID=UPI001BADCCDB|nr:amidohydrolase family protein [Kutzneria sp. CA-103260]QUQ64440.1 M38 family peptidase [Kutzneria sp. CA-103260]